MGIFTPPDIAAQAGTLPPQQCREQISAAGRQQPQTSRTGPKSGHQLSRPRVTVKHFLIVLWLCLIPACTAVTTELIDARVGADSATAPEAATAAKPSGVQKASVPFKNTQPHRHVKLSVHTNGLLQNPVVKGVRTIVVTGIPWPGSRKPT